MIRLTNKQEAFAQHYAIHRNSVEAYKAAGYSWKRMKNNVLSVKAAEVLANGKVSVRVDELLRIKKERANHVFEITADKILQELAAIGFANMQDYMRVDDKGEPILDFSDLKRHQWAAVGEITVEDIVTGQRTGKRTKFKLLDKKGALIELGKHAGVIEDTVNHKHSIIEAPAIEAAESDTDALRRFEEFRQSANTGHAAGHA
jgi:phage terminase small subunit